MGGVCTVGGGGGGYHTVGVIKAYVIANDVTGK